MIAGVGVSNVAELTACLPVELAAVHDDAAQRGAVAADELGGGMDDDICAVLNGTDQVRGAEGIIDDQRQAVLVRDGCNGIDIGDIAVGVAQSFQIDGLVLSWMAFSTSARSCALTKVVVTPNWVRVCSSRL